jgi:hypothetical protein
MAKIVVEEIVWNTDGENVDLPSAVEIEYEDDEAIRDDMDDGCFSEAIINAVSDEQGWLIDDCSIYRVSDNGNRDRLRGFVVIKEVVNVHRYEVEAFDEDTAIRLIEECADYCREVRVDSDAAYEAYENDGDE